MLGFTRSEYSYLRKKWCGLEKSGNLGDFGTNADLKGWFVRPHRDLWVLSQEH